MAAGEGEGREEERRQTFAAYSSNAKESLASEQNTLSDALESDE